MYGTCLKLTTDVNNEITNMFSRNTFQRNVFDFNVNIALHPYSDSLVHNLFSLSLEYLSYCLILATLSNSLYYFISIFYSKLHTIYLLFPSTLSLILIFVLLSLTITLLISFFPYTLFCCTDSLFLSSNPSYYLTQF